MNNDNRTALSEPLLRCGGWLVRRITIYAANGTIAERLYVIADYEADRRRGDDLRSQCRGWYG